MEQSADEIQLINAIRAGERDRFRILVSSHQDQVFRVCLHVLGDHAWAEDLAQETFVRCFQKLDQYDPSKGVFRVWLLTIARRLCLNATKKRRPFPIAEIPETARAVEETPASKASSAEAYRALDEALAKLSEEYRRAFVLSEIEELPHKDIARIEGIAIGTVKSRVSRAKESLRKQLLPIYTELNELPHP